MKKWTILKYNGISEFMKTLAILLLVFIFLSACKTNSSDPNDTNSEPVLTESDSVSKRDELTAIKNEASQPNVPEGSLLIHGKDIWVRDYPNTGKVVMTLNEGDVCKILQIGRHDVIRDNGNRWYEVEFEGKTGWVFGSQTDKPSEDPEEWDNQLGITSNAELLKQNKLLSLQSLECQELMEVTFTEILRTAKYELQDGDTVYKKTVRLGEGYIKANSFDQAINVDEFFSLGPKGDALHSLICKREIGAASFIRYQKTFIAAQQKGNCSFISELKGELHHILPLKNSKVLLILKYQIMDGTLGMQRGHTIVSQYDRETNSVSVIQKLGFYNFHINTDTNWEGGPVDVNYNLESASGKISMTLVEHYKITNSDFQATGMQYKINRFFEFNESRNQFIEVRQEQRSDTN